MVSDTNRVTVITPVYNGEAFLDDCIQSILSQTYTKFRYVIVDNCSTDRSLEIAEAAAAMDDRVEVVKSPDHVGVIQNWNRSLKKSAPLDKYVKFVHADDWLYPDCIEQMVAVAEANESVALVSAYRLEENRVTLDKLPERAPLVPGERALMMEGRSVGKAILAERASVLGSPSSVLMRSASMEDTNEFYDESYLHADKDAALRLFENYDFGFVRQVLVFTRRHNESVSSPNKILDTHRQENLLLLKSHGPIFLSDSEYQDTWRRELNSYYDFLAANTGVGHDSEFWDSHAAVLARAGVALSRWRMAKALLRRWINPALSLKEWLRLRSFLSSRHA